MQTRYKVEHKFLKKKLIHSMGIYTQNIHINGKVPLREIVDIITVIFPKQKECRSIYGCSMQTEEICNFTGQVLLLLGST